MIYLEEEIHIYYILYDLFDLEPPMLRTSHLLLHELIHSPGHLQLMVNFISWIIRLGCPVWGGPTPHPGVVPSPWRPAPTPIPKILSPPPHGDICQSKNSGPLHAHILIIRLYYQFGIPFGRYDTLQFIQ